MKRIITAIIAAALAASISGCSEEAASNAGKQETTSATVSSSTETAPTEQTTPTDTETTQTETTTAETTQSNDRLDPFEGLEVQFDGISPYIHVSINNSKCSKEVQDNVRFSYDETANIANGSNVVIKAELNNTDETARFELVSTEKEYPVDGLPYYVEDFSKIDCSALDKEIQQYMDAHYLDGHTFSGWDQVLSVDGGGSYGGYSRIMGSTFKTSFSNKYARFKKFVSSKCENTYQTVIKPNRIAEFNKDDKYGLNKFNYYFRAYKNIYTMCSDSDRSKAENVSIYVYIWITNVVAYPNGTLKYDVKVTHLADDESEPAYYNSVSSKNDKYNISKVKGKK